MAPGIPFLSPADNNKMWPFYVANMGFCKKTIISGLFLYRLSKFVAFTAAKTLVLRASPAIGMESGWPYAESCPRSMGVTGRKTERLQYIPS